MKSKYFKAFELVPLRLLDLLHEDLLWKLIDDNLILAIDKLKEVFPKGSIFINTYKLAGDRTQSGIRTKNSKYYSETSQHSLGKAVDCIFSYYTTEEVREYILANQDKFPTIGGVELGTSWLHIDVRERRDGKIITFTP
jgi:uncharacterized protein YcbK (DUF882 family)